MGIQNKKAIKSYMKFSLPFLSMFLKIVVNGYW